MFALALTVGEAMDVVDIFGPDPELWPNENRGELDALLKANENFADYVRDVKRIEDMLANWEDDWNGVDVGPVADDEDGRDEEDCREPREAELGEEDEEREGGSAQGGENDDDESEGDLPIVTLDADALNDLEGMLSQVILKHAQGGDPGEFRIFTRDYDEMVEIIAPDDTSLAEIDQAVAKSTGVLQKDMRRLIAAQTQAKRVPGQRRGRLHGPNLHRILAGDDRVFTRREEAEKLDTAISLVIDCSGSMSGERLKLASETAYALGSVLSRLGVTFECLGFTDTTSDPRCNTKQYRDELEAADQVAKITRAHPIKMPKFKTFDERWVQPVQRRFARVYNARGYDVQCGIDMGSTPEGCGIEFAARRLLGRKEKRKIMMVMTDGEPCGHVYNPGDHTHARFAYVKRSHDMVRAIEASGIDLVGIGIQHSGPEKYYANHMTIQSLEDMPKLLMGLLKRFMLGK